MTPMAIRSNKWCPKFIGFWHLKKYLHLTLKELVGPVHLPQPPAEAYVPAPYSITWWILPSASTCSMMFKIIFNLAANVADNMFTNLQNKGWWWTDCQFLFHGLVSAHHLHLLLSKMWVGVGHRVYWSDVLFASLMVVVVVVVVVTS